MGRNEPTVKKIQNKKCLEKSKTCISICKNEEKSNKASGTEATGGNLRLHGPRSWGNKRIDGGVEVVYH